MLRNTMETTNCSSLSTPLVVDCLLPLWLTPCKIHELPNANDLAYEKTWTQTTTTVNESVIAYIDVC